MSLEHFDPLDCVPRSAAIPAQIGSASLVPEMWLEQVGGRRARTSGPLNVVFWGRQCALCMWWGEEFDDLLQISNSDSTMPLS